MKSDAIKISAVLRDSEIIIYQSSDGVEKIDLYL